MRRLLLLCALLALPAAVPAAADADVRWLCRPGLASSPCEGDQTTTYSEPDGSARVGRPAASPGPPVDCFYVYPTVSNQPTSNATKAPDPEVRSIAKYQAQRFSTRCRVYAPLYRQVTAAGVSQSSQTHDTRPYDTAYADVAEAWRAYLRDDNHGRGVVLLGHSQGSRMLRALIRREIDGDAAVRGRLISAIIPGANANDADFAHVPPCDAPGRTGCVVSYHSFNETPPANARFGRLDTDPVGAALALPKGDVLCVDPTALSGTDGRLESLQPTEPFAPGVIAALLVRLYGGPPPTAATPWLQPRDHYTARCERSGGAHVLMIAPVGDARKLTPSPDATWGVHLVDLNLPLGNLTTLVDSQSRAWLAGAAPLAVRISARRAGVRRRTLSAGLGGPPGTRVRVALLRGSRVVARRIATLDGGGRARVVFGVRRAGRYRLSVTSAGQTRRSKTRRITLR
jgi:Protein of unknown function (DUF3089)